MTYLDFLEQKVLLERLVIGLEEPVLIKGLGELSAKIDSGNGGYNVIHGTDFHQQGDELMFTTHDSFGHEKKIQAKVIDSIEVNMGGGNIETRPVIELDIKFAGEDYKKIPFSVSDRSSNTNPILISKGFVENELEALIDVAEINISHEGREVVYGEGFMQGVKNVTKKVSDNVGEIKNKVQKNWDDSPAKKGLKKGIEAGKAVTDAGKSVAKGAWGALKTLGKGATGAASWLKGGENVSLLEPAKGAVSMAKDVVKGVGGAIAALGGKLAWKKICDNAKSIVHGEELMVTDKNAIQAKLSTTAVPNILSKQNDANLETSIIPNWQQINLKEIPIIPITSFLCCKGDDTKNIISGLEQKREQWKKAIQQAKRAVPELKDKSEQSSKDDKAEEQEEEILFEYLTILEGDLILEEADNNMGETQSPPTGDQPPANDAQPQPQTTPQQPEVQGADDLSPDEIQEVQTDFENLQNFTLWFVSIKKAEDGNPDKASANLINAIVAKSDALLSKLFNVGKITSQNITPIINNLASGIQKQGGQGFFVLGLGEEDNKRQYNFFEDVKAIAYDKKQEEEKTAENDINTFSQKLQEELPLKDVEKKIEFDYTTINDEINNGKKDSLLNKIIGNTTYFPNANKYIDSYTSPDTPKEEKKDALNGFNTWATKEYPKFAISEMPNGKQILAALGDFDWNGVEDFIQKCFDNDKVKQMVIGNDDDLSEEDKEWIKKFNELQNNYNHEAEEEPVQEQEEDPWVTEKLALLKSKGII